MQKPNNTSSEASIKKKLYFSLIINNLKEDESA